MKFTEEEQILFKRCVDAWGENSQLAMLVEECSEVIQAISKVWRGKPLALNHLLGELIDVELMVKQGLYILLTKYPRIYSSYSDMKAHKIGRLERLLIEAEQKRP
jgi:hypothetical protein